MKLNCRVESQALGRVQIPHTEVPQAQQIPEADLKQNLGFPEEEGPSKFPDIFIFATQVLVKSLPNVQLAFSFAENDPRCCSRTQERDSSAVPLPNNSHPALAAWWSEATDSKSRRSGFALSNLPTHCSPCLSHISSAALWTCGLTHQISYEN